MSGFFGIFRPDGGQIAMDQFDQMKSAMQRDGYDGMETYVDRNIAVGHLMLRVGNASEFDTQPLKSDCGNFLLFGHFRLDYRDELGDKLGLTQMELGITPDSKLALLAYLKWKDKCSHYLEGDWAFTIFSFDNNKLTLFRDSSGHSAIFYFTIDNSFIFSSDINSIVAITSIQFFIDTKQLFLVSLRNYVPTNGHTIISDLKYLQLSSILSVSTLGTELNFYKRRNSFLGIRKYKFEDDYFQDFHSLFVHALQSKVVKNIKIGLLLSSGFDSTIIGAILSKILVYDNLKLYSITSVPKFKNNIKSDKSVNLSEQSLVEKFIVNKNIIAHFENSGTLTYSELIKKNLGYSYFSPKISKNSIWIESAHKYCLQNDIRILFNGQMGNLTISFTAPLFLFELMPFKLNLLRSIKTVNAYAKRNQVYFLKALLVLIYLQCKLHFHSLIRRKSYLKKTHFKNSFLFPLFKFSRRELIPLVKNNKYWPNFYFFQNQKKIRKDQLQTYLEFSGIKWYCDSSNSALLSIDPTIDVRLIDFLDSVPYYLFNKNGQAKYLFKKTFSKYLTHEILQNKQLIIQTSDFKKRLANDKIFLKLLQEVEPHASQFAFYKKSLYIASLEMGSFDTSPLLDLNDYNDILQFLSCFYLLKSKKNINFTLNI